MLKKELPNYEIVSQLYSWAHFAEPRNSSKNNFGLYVKKFCNQAYQDHDSWEFEFLSRIDSLLFGQYAFRHVYIADNYLPPFDEMSVDTFYNNVSLGVSPEVRESLKNKFIVVYPELGNATLINFDSFDEEDEYWKEFD